MNINFALESTHYFKKVSYRMLKKLHRLENHRSFEKSAKKIDDEYCIVLYLQHMVEVIAKVYKNDNAISDIVSQLNSIIKLLKILIDTTKGKARIDRPLLVTCLHRHTLVFNWLEENKVSIINKGGMFNLWTLKCVPAYVRQFGNKV